METIKKEPNRSSRLRTSEIKKKKFDGCLSLFWLLQQTTIEWVANKQ